MNSTETAKHTPGPWSTSTDEEIAKARADARIREAAPELLELLDEARELMPLGTAKRADWLTRATRAACKAKGEL
jgi:hypothetical protein